MPLAVSKDRAFITDYGCSTATANNAPLIRDMIVMGYKHIMIPDGVFPITETIVVDQDDVVIEGMGMASALELTTGDDVAIDVNGGSAGTRISNCQIKNLKILGEGFSASHVNPSGSATGVAVLARHVTNFSMEGCYLGYHSGYTVYVESARMVQINNNTMHMNYYNNGSGGADVYIGDDVIGLNISHNKLLSNNKLGIYLSSENNSSSVVVDSNLITPLDVDMNEVADGSVTRIHGINYFYGSSNTIVGDQDRKVITKNVIHKTLWDGIYGSGQVGDIPDTGTRVLISNNFLSKCGLDHTTGDDSLQGAIVSLGGRECHITDNIIVDYSGYSSTDGGYTAYGAINVLALNEGCDVVIDNNIIKNTRCRGVYLGGKQTGVRVTNNIIIEQGYDGASAPAIAVFQTNSLRADVTGVTVVASPANTLEKVAHGLTNGMRVAFDVTSNGIDNDKSYYVYNASANQFQLVEQQGSTTVVPLTSGGSFTASDPSDIGGHVISGNRVESYDRGLIYNIANETVAPSITNNVFLNRNLDARSWEGLLFQQDKPFTCTGNTFKHYLSGVHKSVATASRRVEDTAIDDNVFVDCQYGIQATNDGSGNGLIIACNNRFANIGIARIHPTTPTVVEGRRLGNGNIEAWLTAVPTFGTWNQYDVVINSDWATSADVLEWVKTDAGSELFSAATFTARYADRDITLSGDVTGSPTSNQIATGAVTNTKLTDMAAWTLKVRNNAALGDPQDVGMLSFTEEGTPAAGMKVLGSLGSGEIRTFDIGNLPGGSGSGLTFYDAVSSGSAKTIDWTNGNIQKLQLTANCELQFSDPAAEGTLCILNLYQDSTAGWTISAHATLSSKLETPLPVPRAGDSENTLLVFLFINSKYIELNRVLAWGN